MDIVKRLLSWLNYEPNDYIEPAISDIKEAVHEIERLRQRNAELVEALVEAVAYVPRADWHYMTKETRAAIAKATGGE